jgi:hypothetical protein
MTRISTLSMITISGHRSGSSPAHSGSVKTSTPVGHQLSVTRRIATLGPAGQPRRGQPAALAASGERRVAIGRAARHQRQRLTHLTGRKLITPRARLALPRLDPGRALKAEPVRRRPRVLLARQRWREPVGPITIPRPHHQR